jgi:virulence-associated protein VagC
MGFGIGIEVRIEREGERLVLTPTRDPVAEKKRLLDMLARLQAIGAPPDGVQTREPFEFPDRPGL